MAKEPQQQTIPPAPEPQKQPADAPGPTDFLVVTNRNIAKGELSINGQPYVFSKGQQKQVPEQVMLLLKDAGYLAHSAPAR